MAAQGDSGEAQTIIDNFVQGMVAGREIPMLSAGGRLSTALVQFDAEVTALTISRAGAKAATWPLESICAIRVGFEVPEGARVPVPDELCVTLATDAGSVASFHFEDMEERDTFALCMGMFVDNLRASWEQEEGSGEHEEEGHCEEGAEFQEDVASAIRAARAPPAAEALPALGGESAAEPLPALGEEQAELTEAQRLVMVFVRQMVRGRNLEMLSTNGGSVECLVSLDRDVTEIAIQRSQRQDARKRAVPLRSIERIAVGVEAAEDAELPIDELCVALVLEHAKVLAFRFGDVEDRDTFALCLGIFVDGNRKRGRRR